MKSIHIMPNRETAALALDQLVQKGGQNPVLIFRAVKPIGKS